MAAWEKEEATVEREFSVLVLKEGAEEIARVPIGDAAKPLDDLQILNILVAERRAKLVSDAAIEQQAVKDVGPVKGAVDVPPVGEVI